MNGSVDGGDVLPDGGSPAFCTAPAARACGEGLAPCDDGDVCLRNACVQDCGGDVAALDGAFASTLRVLGGACTPPGIQGVGQGCDGDALDVTVYTVRILDGDFEVSQTVHAFRAPSTSVLTRVPGPAGDDPAYVSRYVEVSPTGERLAFGYTRPDFSGEVLVLDLATKAVTRITAYGNYDAAWLDADTVLVNGLSANAEGYDQGLYAVDLSGAEPTARKVVGDLGDASGAVSVYGGGQVVIAGAYGEDLGDDGNAVFAFDGAAIADLVKDGVALSAVSTATIPRVAVPSDFDLVGRSLVSFDYTDNAFHARTATDLSGTAFTVYEPTTFATLPVADVTPLPDGSALLTIPGGVLWVYGE